MSANTIVDVQQKWEQKRDDSNVNSMWIGKLNSRYICNVKFE